MCSPYFLEEHHLHEIQHTSDRGGDHWQPVTLPTPAFHNLTFQIADDLDTIREHSAVPQAAG
jgi:hypothetical protein